MAHNVVMNGKILRKTLKAQSYGIENGSFGFINENASTVGKIRKAPGVSARKTDSKLQPWENTARGAAERAGHSSEVLRRLRIAVRIQRQRLIDFARQHPRHLTLVEFREYKHLHGAWIEASGALWQFEHPGVPSPEFKLTRVQHELTTRQLVFQSRPIVGLPQRLRQVRKMGSLMLVRGLLKGMGLEAPCELIVRKESAVSSLVAYSDCNVIEAPRDLPDGEYIAYFERHRYL